MMAGGNNNKDYEKQANPSDTPPAYNVDIPLKDAKAGGSTAGDAAILELQTGQRGTGFPHGTYFFIQEKDTNKCLSTYWWSKTEGVQIQLWPLQSGGNERRCQLFYIDEAGALCHAMSGLALDIIDDVPVLRRRHPLATRPNPWSHPLPIFTYEDFQIHVQFLSDPAIPVCSEELYPNDSWKSGNYVLATRSEKDFHMHPISDFSPWISRHMMSGISWDTGANHGKAWKVLVEENSEGSNGDRIHWEIIWPRNNS
jgi:hypothetical protein